jgi:very-short-patch-repair endonuclease
MNEIEQMFYDAFLEESDKESNELCCVFSIVPQAVIGIYVVDFVVNDKFIIEIDGYEFHKTKEQREKDYKRERYLLRHGFTVIRFTGTEVFLSRNNCAVEALKLIDDITVTSDYNDAKSCIAYHAYMVQKEGNINAKTVKTRA